MALMKKVRRRILFPSPFIVLGTYCESIQLVSMAIVASSIEMQVENAPNLRTAICKLSIKYERNVKRFLF